MNWARARTVLSSLRRRRLSRRRPLRPDGSAKKSCRPKTYRVPGRPRRAPVCPCRQLNTLSHNLFDSAKQN